MKIWNCISEWQRHRDSLISSVGLVTTMGALHHGHMSLVERARNENDIVVATIFVNPTQFNDPKDLEKYPSTLETDLKMLREANVDHVILPTKDQLYPNGYRFKIEENDTSTVMEGVSRPGFFQGVMTVVLKLLLSIRPTRAYFGEKDYQQLRLVQDMAKDFFVPVEVIACPTIREESGLAAASRNALLSDEGRVKATVVYKALLNSKSVDEAKLEIENDGLKVEYVEERYGRRFAAAVLEGVRLIDNVEIEN
jgi:pantoate--beta-alanine ligase